MITPLGDCFGAENFIKADPQYNVNVDTGMKRVMNYSWHALLKTRVDEWLKNK